MSVPEGVCSVRPVREQDLPDIHRLEEAAWKKRKAIPLSKEELREWYEQQSPFFIIAEQNREACGYYFGQQVGFHPDQVDEFTDRKTLTEKGFNKHPHEPGAKSVYGITVVSLVPGAGDALNRAMASLLAQHDIRYFMGYARMSGFDRFAKKYERAHALDTLALWYAHESMALLKTRTWKQCTEKPKLPVPALARPDPVLAFHIRGTALGLLRVVANYMQDPASRDYGAFVVSETPHA